MCISLQLESTDVLTATPNRLFINHSTQCFGNVGRCASEEVIVELLKTKCLPSLLYCIEACPVNKSVIRSLEYVINNALRKILDTTSCDIANECDPMFNCFVDDTVHRKKVNF